jgi:hypothetical protein
MSARHSASLRLAAATEPVVSDDGQGIVVQPAAVKLTRTAVEAKTRTEYRCIEAPAGGPAAAILLSFEQ